MAADALRRASAGCTDTGNRKDCPDAAGFSRGIAASAAGTLLGIALLTGNAHGASSQSALIELPVADMTIVAPGRYSVASVLAANGGSPMEIALQAAGRFDGATQVVVQSNNVPDAPSRSQVTVVRDGLVDDAVRGERWDIELERSAAGTWHIRSVKRAWLCRRGAHLDRFATVPCP